MSVERFDIGNLRSPRKKANGFIEYDAFVTRTGVFEYRNADGSQRREYRPPSEVFRSDSLQSLASVPVTDDHPPKMLTPDSAKEYTRGAVSPNVSPEGNKIRTSFTVYDSALQRKMTSGRNQISLGYRCDVDFTPGISPEGEAYDAVQRNIVYNHLAVVGKGRAGESIHARLDSADCAFTELSDESGKNTMLKIRIDGVEFEVSESCAQAYEKQQKEHQAASDKLKARADAADDKLTKLQARADAAEDPKKIASLVKERVALEVQAQKHLGDEKFDGLSNRELQDKIAIKLGVKAEALKDASDEYARARFDSAIEQAAAKNDALSDTRKVINDMQNAPRVDADPEKAARKRNDEWYANRHKTTEKS
jgi:hypothetical protein